MFARIEWSGRPIIFKSNDGAFEVLPFRRADHQAGFDCVQNEFAGMRQTKRFHCDRNPERLCAVEQSANERGQCGVAAFRN